MAGKLDGKKVAIVVMDGFEQVELTDPKAALEREGATCEIISPKEGKVKGWKFVDWGEELPVDVPLAQANADDYDALLLPGGVMNPDKLRVIPEVQRFVKTFFDAGKPVAAICHGPWTLIDAGVIEGRRVTSWPSLRTDLLNAGADWVDAEVVVDQGLVTSRKPDDLPAFDRKMIEEFVEGLHGEGRRKRAAAAAREGAGGAR
jgi:protease I